ncbi:hypothetical protein LZ023_37550 (plasmid) [Pseudomonas silvicola]|nr:hypothetical protein LZ023_37550 [Pseudomonas silvicola]
MARQRTWWNTQQGNVSVNDNLDSSRQQRYSENTLSVNISVPLNWGAGLSSVAYNYNQSKQSQSSMATLTGSAGEQRDFSIPLRRNGTLPQWRQRRSQLAGGNLQQNTRLAQSAPTTAREITICRSV